MLPKEKTEKPIDPEDLVDEALEETFPASDPISPGVGPGEPLPNPGDAGATPHHPKSKTEKRKSP